MSSGAEDFAARPRVDISIIVPTWCESRLLRSSLANLVDASSEIIVSDGGSPDQTLEEALAIGARTVCGPRGRARQMNRGRWLARGRYLVFLHADTRLSPDALQRLREALDDDQVCGGCCRLRIEPAGWRQRLTAALANLRSQWLKMPYGDQALFCRREVFDRIGGFRDLPIMEDLDLVDRLRRHGRFVHLKDHALTSDRRWRNSGWIRTCAVHLLAAIAFRLGIHPDRIRRVHDRLLSPFAMLLEEASTPVRRD